MPNKTLLILVTAQPPTFGTVLSIMTTHGQFDKTIICLHDNPILIETETLVKMFSLIFRKPQYEVISHTCDFTTTVNLPLDLPDFDYLATTNERIYINLTAKNYNCYLLPKTIGFDEVIHRVAFKQSQMLDCLRLRMIKADINENKNIYETEGGEN